MANEILLKKYANRRIYDTSRSLFITIEQVAGLVREGHSLRVVDAKSGEDVTAFILTQVILDVARKKDTLLPIPVLHMIIRFGDDVLVDFFENYFQITLRNYLAFKDAFDQQIKSWLNIHADSTRISK